MMAEFYLGHPPKAHLEQFWQGYLQLPAEQKEEALDGQWNTLTELEDQLHFLLGLHRVQGVRAWWKKKAQDTLPPENQSALLSFLAALFKVPLPESAKNLRPDHPWCQAPSQVKEALAAHAGRKLQEKRKHWIHQMELSKNLGLQSEEMKFLEKLQRAFPGDNEFQERRQSSEEQKAHETLLRLKKKHYEALPLAPLDEFSAEERRWLDFLREQIEKKASDQVDRRVLFSYIFLFMEDYESAWLLLEPAPHSRPVQFLRVEILLKLKRYLETLPLIDELEMDCLDQKDLLASLQLSKAKAHYGLRQVDVAVEILRGLVFHEPGFREADVLLRAWEQELGL